MARFDMDYVIHRCTDDRLFILPAPLFLWVSGLRFGEAHSSSDLCDQISAQSPEVDSDATFSNLLQHGVISPLL